MSRGALRRRSGSPVARLAVVVAMAAAAVMWTAPSRAAPLPVLTATPPNGVAPLDVSFGTAGSADGVGIERWRLVFGDGASRQGTGPPPVTAAHRYATPGTYTAFLRLWSSDGTTATRERTVVVRQPGTVPMFRVNAAHTGVSGQTALDRTNVVRLRQRWRVVTGGPVFGSASLANGLVYIASRDGTVRAVDENTGALRWSVALGGPITHTAAVAGGTVVIGASGQPYLWRLDATTGVTRWRIRIGNATSSPVVANGVVVQPVAGSPPAVVAVRLADGVVLWRATLTDVARSTPAISGGRVFVTDFDGYVHAFDAATGARRWRFLTHPDPCPDDDVHLYVCGGIYSSPAVVGGRVYFGARDRKVYALDAATGRLVWSFTTRGHVESSPAVANGTLYVGGNDRYVYALDAATGTLRWEYRTGRHIDSSPMYTNGMVFIGSNDHSLYAFDAATGAVLLRKELPDEVMSSPVVADGMVFVGDGRLPNHGPYTDSSLYAFSL